MDSVQLELNASKHGWNCSECGLFSDALGRPIFGKEVWFVTSTGTAWLENKPKYRFCPGCGKPVKEGFYGR